MSSVDKKHEPKLRFGGFDDAWKAGKASDAFGNSKDKGEAGLPIYSVTLDQGLVPRSSLDRHMAADAADELNLRVNAGQLAYNMMRMWQGAVGIAPEDCMVSPAYVVLDPKEGTHSAFFDYWFKAPRMLYLLWAYSHGLTSDRLRLYYNDFAQIPLHVPTKKEQEKIADFLEAVDLKLAALREKEAALTRFKRGLMEALFSQTLRFTRDDGSSFPDWEEKRLGSAFEWVRTNSLSREYLTDAEGPIQNIHYGDIHTKFKALFRQDEEAVPSIAPNVALNLTEADFCQLGDVVIADASEDYADIGKAIEIVQVRDQSLVAGLHTYIARPIGSGMALGFSGYLWSSEPMRRQIMRIAQGISVLGISKTNLEQLKVSIPSLEEQRKIAAALSALDAKTAAVSEQITQLTAFKKSLLQQMFV